MTCKTCEHIIDRPEIVHVLRTCSECGREMRVHEPGEHGLGFKVEKGDRVVLPAGALQFAFDPRRASGHFFKGGISWFAKMIFVDDLPSQREEFGKALASMREASDRILRESTLLSGFDPKDEQQARQAWKLMQEHHQDSLEWFASWHCVFLVGAERAIQDGDANLAAWAMACAERFRAMIVFKQHLEEVVWMGHSAKRVVDALRTWDAHRSNDDEAFWQITFSNNSFVLSQVFAAPIVFIQDKAYVGGTQVDGKGGKFVDYLATMESSSEAVLVEIKRPVTKLLGGEYRPGIYQPSADLTGAIVQARDYRAKLIENHKSLGGVVSKSVAPLDPRCVVIAGDGASELTTPERRRSFELFRSALKDVEVVTYDELFRKVEVLAQLFNLSRSKQTEEPDGRATTGGAD